MAVILDFFIVVVGVFIGIQAANWNDERRAREQRAASLDRLHSETEASVAYLSVIQGRCLSNGRFGTTPP